MRKFFERVSARMFGKKVQGVDLFDGILTVVTAYKYKGCLYVMSIKTTDYNPPVTAQGE